MKKLGFGLMRLPLLDKETNEIDIEQVESMVDYFIAQGFSYFDTAWFYHDEKSEDTARIALTERYVRKDYELADKMPIALLDSQGKTEEEMAEELEEYFSTQLERCGVEYFDFYLLHALDKEKFQRSIDYKAYDFIKEKQRQGYIKHIGFSFHDTVEVLEEILDTYRDMDFVQLQINYLDWDHEKIQSRKCYEKAIEYDMDIIIMEPLKGGTLSKLPEPAAKLMEEYNPEASLSSWAIRFAAGLDNVFMVLSGMSNMDQMIDNANYMKDFKPLNSQELEIIKEVVEIIKSSNNIQCTECEYCLGECPEEIPIPSYFAMYNRDLQGLGGNHRADYFKKLEKKPGPDDCIQCRACESICPQHLEIIKDLQVVDKHFNRENLKYKQ